MLVGEGGAGKTSTLRSLLCKEFIDTSSTIAMDVSTCKLDRTNTANWAEVDCAGPELRSVASEVVAEKIAYAQSTKVYKAILMTIRLPVCLSICLPIHLSVCPSVRLCARLPIQPLE